MYDTCQTLTIERGRYVVLMRYARSVIEIRATRGEMDIDLSLASLVSTSTKPDSRYGSTLIVNRKQKMVRGESEFCGSVNARVRASDIRKIPYRDRMLSFAAVKREYESTSTTVIDVKDWSPLD